VSSAARPLIRSEAFLLILSGPYAFFGLLHLVYIDNNSGIKLLIHAVAYYKEKIGFPSRIAFQQAG
jgi:hypothetical protein